MERLPYGTFPLLSKEEQREHVRQRRRAYHAANREKLNARNKAFIEKWKKTKPFVVQCQWCGEDFNACRRCIKVCPNCHQKAHEHAQSIKMGLIARRNAKTYLMDKVVALRKKGLLQTEIARELNLSQRNVSNYLVKMGYRTMPEYHRRRKI